MLQRPFGECLMAQIANNRTTSDVRRRARFSKCGRYRWSLERIWPRGNGQTVCFVMLNPSTADAVADDPTIRRCMGFAQSCGYSRLVVRNLFPIRATNPRDLLKLDHPTAGASGTNALRRALKADIVIAAWGGFVPFDRDAIARRLFRGRDLYCLGVTKNGNPRHPLYVAATSNLVTYEIQD